MSQDEQAAATGDESHVLVRLCRDEATTHEHVKVDDFGRGLAITRSGVRRSLQFGHAFGIDTGNAEFDSVVVQPLVHASFTQSSHSVLCYYGMGSSGRRHAVAGDEKAALPSICKTYVEKAPAGTVEVQATLIRGEQAITDLLPRTHPHGTPLTRKMCASLMSFVGRAEEQGTVFVTFTVMRDGGAAKLTVVLFEAVDQLTPATRKHPSAVAGMMRNLSDPKAASGTLRLASRNSKLTHMLHACQPPAFAPGSSTIFVATSSLFLNDAGEHVLRFASDLHAATSAAHAPVSPPQCVPLPAPAPSRWAPTDTRASASMSSKALSESRTQRSDSGSREDGRAHVRNLETELLECKSQLFESRQKLMEAEGRCESLQERVRDIEGDAAVSLQRESSASKQLQRQREGKRLLQLKVSELEQRCDMQAAALQQSQDELDRTEQSRDVLRQELHACQKQLEDIEKTISDTVAETVEVQLSAAHRPHIEWKNAGRDEAEQLRRHLEEAQQHIRQLSEQLSAEAPDPSDITGVLSRQLELWKQMSQLHCSKADTYEKRLQAILHTCDSPEREMSYQVETEFDRVDRRALKAELELQEVKLEHQARESRALEHTRDLMRRLEDAESRTTECGAEPDASAVEEYVKDKSRLLNELQAVKDEAQRLAEAEVLQERELAAKRTELDAAQDDIDSLQRTLRGLQGVEQTAHLNITKLAEASLSNAQLRSEAELLRQENVSLAGEVERLRLDVATQQDREEALRSEAECAHEKELDLRRTLETHQAGSRESDARLQELQDTYVAKIQQLTESLHDAKDGRAALQTERDSLEAQVAMLRQEALSERRIASSLESQREKLSSECDDLRQAATAAAQRASDSDNRVRVMRQEVAEMRTQHARAEENLHAAKDQLIAAEKKSEFLKREEELRAEQEVASELSRVKESESLATQNRELNLALQVKAAVIQKLEKQLARQTSMITLSGAKRV
eukprot:TRINITY_DN32947_c0_g1_i1.p1 TRINITY_DN32947_c0_g1~~TRINITY_DN32947_c0_g1_i1.p1  ORF type:complete len:972 (+),score=272.56 TRINITY_DN32947_c0_g1_i1:39-2954(+)